MSSKAFRILQKLKPSELESARFVINNGSRVVQKKLFECLIKARMKKQEPDKETVFRAVYDKPFDPGADYLLRNEYRLLTELLESVLLQAHLKKHNAFRGMLLVDALNERDLEKDSGIEMEKAIRKATKEENWPVLSLLLEKKIETGFESMKYTVASSREWQEQLAQWSLALQRNFTEKTTRSGSKAGLQRTGTAAPDRRNSVYRTDGRVCAEQWRSHRQLHPLPRAGRIELSSGR